MEAALPNQGELSNASAVEIMNVIRRRRAGDDGGLRKVSDGAVTMDDILALRRSESVERKAAGDSGAQQGGELGTRDTTTDRREYLRRRGR